MGILLTCTREDDESHEIRYTEETQRGLTELKLRPGNFIEVKVDERTTVSLTPVLPPKELINLAAERPSTMRERPQEAQPLFEKPPFNGVMKAKVTYENGIATRINGRSITDGSLKYDLEKESE